MREEVKIQANAMKGINEISMKGEIVVLGSTYMAKFPISNSLIDAGWKTLFITEVSKSLR